MQYFGGKHRIAKRLVDYMTPGVLERGIYVEPFVGGASVMSLMSAPVRIASDANVALVTMWRALAVGWTPPTAISEEDYARVKSTCDPLDPLTAFVGIGLSFSGKWFGGFARDGTSRNYAANAETSLRRKNAGLRGVEWHAGDYRDCPMPSGAVIYCDPPYAGTTQYDGVGKFVTSEFWDWCLSKSEDGHIVFVSEYDAPEEFEPVLSIHTKTDVRTKFGKARRVEKLFMPRHRGMNGIIGRSNLGL